MPFNVKDWRDALTYAGGGDTSTPLSSTALEDMERRLSDYVDEQVDLNAIANVKAYGAVGDGAADDTAEIQAAINAVSSVGGTVYFPPGTYIVTSTLTFYTKTHLLGTPATTLKLAPAANCVLLRSLDADSLWGDRDGPGYGVMGARIEQLTLDGSKINNTSGHGIQIYGAGFTFADLHIHDFVGYGILSDASGAGDYDLVPDERGSACYMTRLDVHGCGIDGLLYHGPHDGRLANSQFWQNAAANIHTDALGGIHMSHIHCWGGEDAATSLTDVSFYAAAPFSCVNSDFETSKTANVILAGLGANTELPLGASSSNFTGCRFYGAGAHGGVTNGAAVQIGQAPGGWVGNTQIIGSLMWSNDYAFSVVADAGGSVIEAQIDVPVGSSLYPGTWSPDTTRRISTTGGGTTTGRGAVYGTGTAQLELQATAGDGYIQMVEQSSSPAAPAANAARLFVADNGTGKTQLKARFNSGGIVPLATELGYETITAQATMPVPGALLVTVPGTTNITSVTAGHGGQVVTFVFGGILTFTDGSNLKLAGNFVTSADDSITLICDGTNWYEIARSVN